MLAREQRKEYDGGGYHFDKLHDQNETATGERYDIATGKEIRNDGNVETPHKFENDQAAAKKIREDLKNDPATEWLRKNGYDELGNKRNAA